MKKLLLFLGAFLVALLLAEAVFRGWLRVAGTPYSTAETRAAIERLAIEIEQPPSAFQTVETDGEEGPLDAILHPFSAFEIRHSLRQVSEGRNYFQGPASKRTFDILLVGGSVAGLFYGQGVPRLTEILRADERLAGRPVRVHCFARAGFKQPQQTIIVTYLLSMGYRPDAVLNIDGHNELVQAMFNGDRDIHPLWPLVAKWGPVVRGEAPNRELLDAMLDVRQVQHAAARLARRASRLGLARSSLAGGLVRGRMQSLEREWVKANHRYLALAGDASALSPTRGPPFEPGLEAVVDMAVECWEDASRSLHDICAARSIQYLHVLQPTMHDEGSKPLTEAERAVGGASKSWIDAVQRGYPLLRERGSAMRSEGVGFLDGSRVFTESTETHYIDPCHFDQRGNEILAEEIGPALLALLPR